MEKEDYYTEYNYHWNFMTYIYMENYYTYVGNVVMCNYFLHSLNFMRQYFIVL